MMYARLLVKTLLPALSILLIPYRTLAQFYNYGQDRSSIKWERVKDDSVDVIFDRNHSERAYECISYLKELQRRDNSLKTVPLKIPYIIRSNGGNSNGMVTRAPFSTNLYTLPPQDPGDIWIRHLTAHEYRHTVQLQKLNNHITKGFSYIFGEISPAVVTGLYVPFWFLEGDATSFETSMTHFGRGRSPEFINRMKASLLEDGIFEYNKCSVGSFKDYVPNKYVVGYFLTTKAREHYGSDIWETALERSARKPFSLNPFSHALAERTSSRRDSLWASPRFRQLFNNPDSVKQSNTFRKTKYHFYTDIMLELQAEWKKNLPEDTLEGSRIPTVNKAYTDYHYPTPISRDSVIAYKSGFDESGAIVLLTGGKEERITRTGPLYDKKIAYARQTVLWSEFKRDTRWTLDGRQQLCTYSLAEGKYRRYPSADNRYGVFATDNGWGCVEVTPGDKARILLLDQDMNGTFSIAAPDRALFIHPTWYGGRIYSILQEDKGNTIVEIDPADGSMRRITENFTYELDNPSVYNGKIYFRASFNTNNALYSLDLESGEITYGGESRFGTSMPCIKDSILYYSNYTSKGYKPARIHTDSLQDRPAEFKKFILADKIAAMERGNDTILYLDRQKADTTYPGKRYSKTGHLFKIHSWGPLYGNRSPFEISVGAVLYSQNILNTMALNAGYVLREGYRHGAWITNLTYRGWRPYINLHGEYGKKDISLLGISTTDTILYSSTAGYGQFQPSVFMPFKFNRRNRNTLIQPQIEYNLEGFRNRTLSKGLAFRNRHFYDTTAPIRISGRKIRYMDYSLYTSTTRSMTLREIIPSLGYNLHVGFSQSIYKKMDIGNLFYTSANLYLPGITKNHSINLYGGYQQASRKDFIYYGRRIGLPRGIHRNGTELASLKASYTLPICYPERFLARFLYFQRIYSTLFYDYGYLKNPIYSRNIFSAGAEIRTDFNLSLIAYSMNMGVQFGYESLHKKGFVKFVYTIELPF